MPMNSIRAYGDPQNNVVGINMSGWVDARSLAAGVNESYTLPTPPVGEKVCIISPSTDLYIRPGGVAVVTASDITDGTASILLPAGTGRMFYFDGEIVSLGLIAPANCLVQFEWWQRKP